MPYLPFLNPPVPPTYNGAARRRPIPMLLPMLLPMPLWMLLTLPSPMLPPMSSSVLPPLLLQRLLTDKKCMMIRKRNENVSHK